MPRSRIQREVDAIRASRPGRRFVDAHERHRISNHALRLTVIGAGGMLAFAGAATFWLPGPNFVIVLVGLGIVAGQWRLAARLFDRIEVVLRHWHDHHWAPFPHKRLAIVVTWLAVVLVLVAIAWIAGRLGLVPEWVPIFG